MKLNLLLGFVILLSSCASKMSNGRVLKDEKFACALVVEKRTKKKPSHGIVPFSDFPSVVWKVATVAAKKAIDWESKKYSQTSTVVVHNNLLGGTSAKIGSDKIFMLLIRSYAPSDKVENDREEFLSSASNSLKKAGVNRRASEKMLRELKKDSDRIISFAGVVELKPLNNRREYVARLVSYSYPMLKAKNSAIHIPWLLPSKTDSILELKIEGAKGEYGGALSSTNAIKLKWDRESPSSEWKIPKKQEGLFFVSTKIKSDAYQKITFTLREDSNMAKYLESAKDEIDFESWAESLSDDDSDDSETTTTDQ